MADPPAQPSNQSELLQDAETRKPDGQAAAPPKDAIEPFRMPSPEEMQAQDFMNNCLVRSAFAGVAGELECSPVILLTRFQAMFFGD
jgi:hypothetical protein